MRNFHSLSVLVLCVLAACEPSPSPSASAKADLSTRAAGLEVKLGTAPSQLLASDVPILNFPAQRVCGAGAEKMFTVFNDHPTESRKILFAQTSDPFAVAEITDEDGTVRTLPFILGAQKRLSFRVKFSPLVPNSKPYMSSLQIFTDDPVMATFQITLSGQGTGPRLEMNPSSLILSPPADTADAGTPDDAGTDVGTPGDAGLPDTSFRRTVLLKNTGTERLTSLALGPITAFSSWLSKSELDAGETADLVVTFAPPASSSEPFFKDTLSVTSDDPCASSSQLSLSGFRTPGPAPTLKPSLLAFEDQEVGSVSTAQTVTVTNEGAAALVIDSILIPSTSDAGTQFTVSPDGGFVLEPGLHRDLSVKFYPTATGNQSATLQLVSNGKTLSPSTTLRGTAVGVTSLVLEPASLVFPRQRPGEVAIPQTVIITNTGPASVQVTAALTSATDPTAFDFDLKETFTLGPLATRPMTVTLKPSSSTPSSPLLGQITLTIQDPVTSTSRQVGLPIQGEVVRTSVDLPKLVSFADQIVGAPPQAQELLIHNPTALPVKVYAVAAGSLGPYSITGLPMEIPANESKSLTILFDPSSRQQWDTILQLTSDATEGIAAVKLSGKALAPVLSITDPVSLDLAFGAQAVGTMTPLNVTLKNTGDVDLTVAKLSDLVNFKVQGLNPPRTVSSNDSLTFQVLFAPTSMGVKEETLQFYTGSSSTPLASPQLKLSGAASGPSASFNGDLDFKAQRINELSLPRVLTISNDASALEPLEIVSISNDQTSVFTLDADYKGRTAGPGESINVSVGFKPTTLDKTYVDQLRIAYRGTSTRFTVTNSIPLKGVGATALLDVADALNFDAVELNKPKRLSLTLTNQGKSLLSLKSLGIENDTTGGAFTLDRTSWPKDVPADGTEVLYLTFIPQKLDFGSADLFITSNATSSNVTSGKTTVHLSGSGAAAKALFPAMPLVVDNTPLGQVGTASLRVSNAGTSPLRINKVNPSTHFKVRTPTGDWPVVIDIKKEGETDNKYFDFVIEFQPSDLPMVTEKLSFSSNDPVTPVTELSVEGMGTKPKLVMDPTLLFGQVVPIPGGSGYQAMSRNLQVKNEGTAPLVIRSLQVDQPFCIYHPTLKDCVDRTPLDFTGLTLQPNEAQLLEVRVTPTAEKVSGTLTLTTNEASTDGFTKTVALFVGADGVSVPTEPVEFGTCDMNTDPTILVQKGLTVVNTADAEDSITSVTFSETDALDFAVSNVSATTPLKIPGKGGAELKLSFKPRIGAAGQRTATAHLYTRLGKKLEFGLVGAATGRFSGFKDFTWEVDFGTQRLPKQDEPKKEPVRFPLQNQLDRSIFVKRFWLDGPQAGDFAVEADDPETCRKVGETQALEVRMGETCYLKLSYVAQQATLSSAVLVLELATSEGEELPPASRVALKGEMISSILLVDPMEVDFGWVDLGDTIEPKEITVTNQSSVATRVLVPEVADPDTFTVEALEPGKELPPGGVTRLRVMFHPTAGGEATSELRLRLNGEQVPDVTLGLHGQARAVLPKGGGCSSGGSEGGILGAGGLLLMALGVRRRSRQAAP